MSDVEVIASTGPVYSAGTLLVDGSASPDLLKPILPLSMTCRTLNWLRFRSHRPLMLYFTMDSEVLLSTSPVSTVPVPPGFAPIGSPGSLAMPPVTAGTVPHDFALPVSPVSLFSSGPLSLSHFQPACDESYEVRHTTSPSTTIPAVGSSPAELALAGSSSSPVSEQSDGSFYSAVDSLSSLFLMQRLPTVGSGITRAVVHTTSQLIAIMTTPSSMYSLVCSFITHGSWSGWGAPESARLMGHASSEWIRSLTLDAARQLQRDACLMTSNLSVLDQYPLSLHGTASDMLELVVGRHDFPSVAMDTAAPMPHVRSASTHMEALGLWRPPHGPGDPALDVVHQGPPHTGFSTLHCECPVGSRFLSSRTRELFPCLQSHTL